MKNGFTLIELIIIVAMMLLVIGLGIPYFGNTINKNSVNVTALELQQNIRYAQSKAIAGEGNSRWGVYLVSDSYTLYKGANYVSRDTAYDLVTSTEGQFTLSGLMEINFTKRKGKPSATGTINVIGPESQIAQVIINTFGVVSIQ